MIVIKFSDTMSPHFELTMLVDAPMVIFCPKS